MTADTSLRLNDIKLPLAHSAAELTAAVLTALSVAPGELQDVAVYKRSYDARKKSDIQLIYSLDVRLCDAARERVLAANAGSTVAFTVDASSSWPTWNEEHLCS